MINQPEPPQERIDFFRVFISIVISAIPTGLFFWMTGGEYPFEAILNWILFYFMVYYYKGRN